MAKEIKIRFKDVEGRLDTSTDGEPEWPLIDNLKITIVDEESEKVKEEVIYIIKEHGNISVYSKNSNIRVEVIDNDTKENDTLEEQKEAENEFKEIKDSLHLLHADY